MLKVDLEYYKKVLFIRLNGVLTRSTSYKINNYLVPVILKQKIKYGVLNLQNITDIDEDGIDSLHNIKYAIKSNHGLVYLYENNKNIVKKINKLHLKKITEENDVLNIIGA